MIFVSHSHQDRAATEQVVALLEALGYGGSVFVDWRPQEGLLGGREWLPQLLHQLAACRVLVAVATPAWCASRFCFFEALHARAKEIPIIPIRFGDAELDRAFGAVQHIDAGPDAGLDPSDGTRQRLGRALAHLLPVEEALPLIEGRDPFPGPRAFEEQDAALFAGRDREIADALGLIQELARNGPDGPRCLVLVGAAGVGKSSLLRAGILPRLRRREAGWRIAFTARPKGELAELLAVIPSGPFALAADDAPVQVVAVDQLEELLGDAARGTKTAAASRSALAMLARLVAGPRPVVLLATLTADLLDEFRRRFVDGSCRPGFHALDVALPQPDMLDVMVREPLRRGGGGISADEALLGQIRADMAQHLASGSSAALAMLACALCELWRDPARGGRLTLAAYRQVGGLAAMTRGLSGPLRTRLASPADRKRLQAVLVPRLVIAAEGGQLVPRRPLLAAFAGRERALVDELRHGRVLTDAAEGRVGLIHDTLLEALPQLRAAIDAERPALAALARLKTAATRWSEAATSRPELLVHGLAECEALKSLAQEARFEPEFDDATLAYLAACEAAAGADAAAPPPATLLPAFLRDGVGALLGILDRLRLAPGVRLADIEAMARTILGLAEEAVSAGGADEAPTAVLLVAELELRLAQIHRGAGNPGLERAAAERAWHRLDPLLTKGGDDPAFAGIVGRLAAAARLQAAEAAAAAGDAAGMLSALAEAERVMPRDGSSEVEATSFAIRQSALLREAGQLNKAQRTMRGAIDRLDDSPQLAGTHEGEYLRAACLRELGAALTADPMRPDGRHQGGVHAETALAILRHLETVKVLGKRERLLKAALIHNRAVARPPDEIEAAEAGFAEAVAEVHRALELDPGDLWARSDLAFYLEDLTQRRLDDQRYVEALKAALEAFAQSMHLARTAPGNRSWGGQLELDLKLVVRAAMLSDPPGDQALIYGTIEMLAEHGFAQTRGDGARRLDGYRLRLLAAGAAAQLGWTTMALDALDEMLGEAPVRRDDALAALRAEAEGLARLLRHGPARLP